MRHTADIIPIPIKQELECSKCGALGTGSCHCGAPYLPAGERAEEAVKANPEKSDRKIAEEIGVSDTTVQRARKRSGASREAPEKRKGKDGKSYPSKPKRKEKESYKPCDPILTKDPSVNGALVALYDFLRYEFWTDSQLKLFLAAVQKFHGGMKGTIDWEEAKKKRKEERLQKRESNQVRKTKESNDG